MTVAVDVWRIDLTQFAPEAHALVTVLSRDERVRADRFRRERDFTTYVTTRSLLRQFLAERLGCPAAEVRFRYGSEGKPYVESSARWQFSVSHSADIALIALAEHREIGVDVEAWSSVSIQDASLGVLADAESKRIRVAEDPAATLCDHWTRKEAWFKARGRGLDWSARYTVTTPGRTEWLDGYLVENLAVPKGYSAALAVQTTDDSESLSVTWRESSPT